MQRARLNTSIGIIAVDATDAGVCRVHFEDEIPEAEHADVLKLTEAPEWAAAVARAIDEPSTGWEAALRVPLDVRGTEFQRRVWEALRQIPVGETRSYGEIARRIGAGAVARAVGGACGANPIAVLVPCHRAVGADGSLTGFRGGLHRKRALLERERAAGALWAV